MKCVDCAYYWKEDWEDHPQCHWVSRCPGDTPPCEEDDYESPFDEEYEESEYYDDYEESNNYEC